MELLLLVVESGLSNIFVVIASPLFPPPPYSAAAGWPICSVVYSSCIAKFVAEAADSVANDGLSLPLLVTAGTTLILLISSPSSSSLLASFIVDASTTYIRLSGACVSATSVPCVSQKKLRRERIGEREREIPPKFYAKART